jgi:CubicO group peptidase (beta-lactamase class C family)
MSRRVSIRANAAGLLALLAPTTALVSCGGQGVPFDGLTKLLEAGVAEHAFPSAVVAVGIDGEVLFTDAVGYYGDEDRRQVTDSTVYDLASLTKVIGLTTAVMLLVAENQIDLNATVRDYLPEFSGDDKRDVLVRHLLTHTSGLPAWRPLYLETESREEALDTVFATPLESVPGEHYVYSDLGAILMTLIVERVSGSRLDVLLENRVFGPLGMSWTRYRPPPEWRDRIAPTEDDPWRGKVVRGEVHDENAVRLGGVSGHAGLFSCAPDLARYAKWILGAYHGRLEPNAPLYVPSEVVTDFARRQPGPEGSTRALGWDTPSPEGSSAGTLMSRSSFGHTGFTGTSIWIDPETEMFVILLTNRVHPTRESNAIRRYRGMAADSAVVAIGRLGTEH